MMFKDFAAKYSLHDSSIEKIEFDAANKILALTIESCWWLPNGGKPGEMINGVIRATFTNVSRFEYDDRIADKIFGAELDSEVLNDELDEEGNFIVFVVDYLDREEIYCRLKICAANVEVAELAELERHIFND